MTEQTQKQLGKTLWAIADDLRGATNAEQQRIAACLGSLDAAVAAEAQALAALRTHKKGLLQQLFPAAEGD